ncbi:(deoxy)nucleoside triphosphate pyrophosphohydrolase [soil metagenome]
MSASLTRVVAAVVERGHRVLIALRPPDKRYGGMWEFPGGKVEGSESDLEALRRELAEELRIHVVTTSPPVATFQDPGSAFLIVFVPVVAEGEPECREHLAIYWATWPELAELPLAPTDARFVASRSAARA